MIGPPPLIANPGHGRRILGRLYACMQDESGPGALKQAPLSKTTGHLQGPGVSQPSESGGTSTLPPLQPRHGRAMADNQAHLRGYIRVSMISHMSALFPL